MRQNEYIQLSSEYYCPMVQGHKSTKDKHTSKIHVPVVVQNIGTRTQIKKIYIHVPVVIHKNGKRQEPRILMRHSECTKLSSKHSYKFYPTINNHVNNVFPTMYGMARLKFKVA